MTKATYGRESLFGLTVPRVSSSIAAEKLGMAWQSMQEAMLFLWRHEKSSNQPKTERVPTDGRKDSTQVSSYQESNEIIRDAYRRVCEELLTGACSTQRKRHWKLPPHEEVATGKKLTSPHPMSPSHRVFYWHPRPHVCEKGRKHDYMSGEHLVVLPSSSQKECW